MWLCVGAIIQQISIAQTPKPIQGNVQTVPDRQIRKLSKSIKMNTVKAIRFYGIQMNCFENDPIIVRDPNKVKLIINSLSGALTTRLQVANRINTMEIYFKSPGKHSKPRKSIMLSFNLLHAVYCFSPQFQAEMIKLSKIRKPLSEQGATMHH